MCVSALTFSLLLDLQCDRLPCHLQQVDGLTERFALQTVAVNGQDAITNVDGSSPVETRAHQITLKGQLQCVILKAFFPPVSFFVVEKQVLIEIN